MKNMRIPLLIAWSVAVIGIIFGSFFDLQISTAIASPDNTLGLTISAIGPTLGFMGVALMGGGFIALIVKGKYHIALKILFGVLAAACLVVSIMYPAGEWFGINGFYWVEPDALGYAVVALPEIGAMVGGYFLFRNYKNENIWIVFCVIVVLLLVALLGVIPLLKGIFHRPRFRLITSNDAIGFHNWWEPCKNYQELKDTYGIASDNFKSYPSGHTAEASILLVATTLFPLADERLKKIQLPAFICAFVITVLVAFARILAAAHFLSDVSFGAVIVLTPLIIANEIIMRIKPLQLKEEAE